MLDAVLGAGALSTATEFERFEDALGLGTTGGRGRGSNGGTGNLGGFGSTKVLKQLQVRSAASLQQLLVMSGWYTAVGREQHLPNESIAMM